ncbi:MAG: nicotinate phosphoribosyltransferase [candidate division KSB1 bacterium]|nr:nicotinate phosphoribosyltransferase [candidate division KSB1 bacterium]
MNELSSGILFTDQYQLSMAQLYYRLGLQDTLVQFEHYFRDTPDDGAHKAGFCINAGLEPFCRWMQKARFGEAELEALAAQRDRSGRPVFHQDFLDYLRRHGDFSSLSLSAIPEGRVVHPFVPLTTVRGPIVPAQIVETALLNKLNFQILIATKACRIKMAAQGRPVLEFGLRRAHDLGANAAVRAALIGGADYSSNVGQSIVLGFPPKGTHAHSMVQLFLTLGYSELDAFRAFAELYPENCVLLVDTIDTLRSGVPNAIRVFEELRRRGHEPIGVRIDSGDLAYLTLETAKMLDQAGFDKAAIVLSNDLDELTIWQIHTQIAEDAPKYGLDADRIIGRLIYGVGTRMVTSAGAPALGGVYKLTAVHTQGAWKPSIKISENITKAPNPGVKRIWRIYDQRGKAAADVLGCCDESLPTDKEFRLYHPIDFVKNRLISPRDISAIEPLPVEIIREGVCVYEFPTIEEIRKAREADIERLDTGVKRLINPHVYHVSLTETLYRLKEKMLMENGSK